MKWVTSQTYIGRGWGRCHMKKVYYGGRNVLLLPLGYALANTSVNLGRKRRSIEGVHMHKCGWGGGDVLDMR
jgi:hypothetical protein